MLIVSHDLDTITEVSDSVLLLDAGRIVRVGEPGQVVDQYKSLGFQKAGAVVVREWGTKEAVISAVRFTDGKGGAVERILSGEPLVVELDWRAGKRIEDPVFGFAVTKGDGTLCIGSNTLIDPFPIDAIEGEGTLRLSFPSLPLLRGRYYFSFSLHTRDHKTSYHRLDNRFSLWVDSPRKAEGWRTSPAGGSGYEIAGLRILRARPARGGRLAHPGALLLACALCASSGCAAAFGPLGEDGRGARGPHPPLGG